jgi:hypothetical protein
MALKDGWGIMRLILIVLAALAFSSPALALQCTPSSSWACVDGSCKAGSSAITIYFSPSEKTVSRCDSQGCSTLQVEAELSGAMLKAASAVNGYLLVVNVLDLTFTEVATSVTSAFIKMGACKE